MRLTNTHAPNDEAKCSACLSGQAVYFNEPGGNLTNDKPAYANAPAALRLQAPHWIAKPDILRG